LPLSELWMDRPSPSLIPNTTKIPWKLPNNWLIFLLLEITHFH
jgi:hypothetical protein